MKMAPGPSGNRGAGVPPLMVKECATASGTVPTPNRPDTDGRVLEQTKKRRSVEVTRMALIVRLLLEYC